MCEVRCTHPLKMPVVRSLSNGQTWRPNPDGRALTPLMRPLTEACPSSVRRQCQCGLLIGQWRQLGGAGKSSRSSMASQHV